MQDGDLSAKWTMYCVLCAACQSCRSLLQDQHEDVREWVSGAVTRLDPIRVMVQSPWTVCVLKHQYRSPEYIHLEIVGWCADRASHKGHWRFHRIPLRQPVRCDGAGHLALYISVGTIYIVGMLQHNLTCVSALQIRR